MIVLGIDTCGTEGSLGLARIAPPESGAAASEWIGEVTLTGRRYAGALIPELRALLARHTLEVRSLGAVVVVHGPGSFTGIRMGLSLAKALAEAAALPMVALSRLQVLARTHRSAHAVLDAGRDEFYFLDSAGEWLLTRDEVPARAAGGRLVTCDPAAAAALPAAERVPPPGASAAILLAHPRLLLRDFDDPASLDGNYVRRPEFREQP